MPRVAVVTGGNKGVGLSIVRALCRKFDGDVILTARDVSRGQQAVKLLQQEGLHPKFFQLDVTSVDSITSLKSHLQENYGGLDILINNAAIAHLDGSSIPFDEQAEQVIKTNFVGAADVSEILFPLFRKGFRLVNISSGLSAMSDKTFTFANKQITSGGISNTDLYNKLKSDDISLIELRGLMQQFVRDVRDGVHVEKGWPIDQKQFLNYHVSKIGLNVMTRIMQRLFDESSHKDMIANACSPGSVLSDMNPYGERTPEQGAECPSYLALLPAGTQEPKGQFVSSNKQVVNWF